MSGLYDVDGLDGPFDRAMDRAMRDDAAAGAAAVRERPILFSGSMVRAILAGTKTQALQIVRGPEKFTRLSECAWACPYGVPGDRLWVRETWALRDDVDWKEQPEKAAHYALFRATCSGTLDDEYHPTSRWRSARFMPRILSRLTLDVTEVRVQRLAEIAEDDARAEGFGEGIESHGWNTFDGAIVLSAPVGRFRLAWDEINGKRAPWASNPWVWAITFKRCA